MSSVSIHTGSTQVELLRWLLLSLAAVAALHAFGIAWVMAGFMPCAFPLSQMPGSESLETELNSSLWDFNSCS